MIRVTLRDILEGAGYEVQEAANGAEGFELVRNRAPSLVMPDMPFRCLPSSDGSQRGCRPMIAYSPTLSAPRWQRLEIRGLRHAITLITLI